MFEIFIPNAKQYKMNVGYGERERENNEIIYGRKTAQFNKVNIIKTDL